MPADIAPTRQTPIRVVIISMDAHLAGPIANAEHELKKTIPGLKISLHAASAWDEDASAAATAIADIERADILIAGMLFLENQIEPILPALQRRSEVCDATVGILADPRITRLTRLDRLQMDKPQSGPLAFLKRLRGKPSAGASNGQQQAKMLRRIPKILKYVPGTAQDLRSYLLTMQYWLAGSEENVRHMIVNLINRYADHDRLELRGLLEPAAPVEYPDVGIYHPAMAPRMTDDLRHLPRAHHSAPTVGLLITRSYALAADTEHYDGVIAAMESRGLNVIPAFASGLDARPAIERYFVENGRPRIDALVSLTGFSLVGGPAYNDAGAAVDLLNQLDVPYLAGHALEFQTLSDWAEGEKSLSPVESTMMIAIPELEGATNPTVFGGRSSSHGEPCDGCERRCRLHDTSGLQRMRACPERAEHLADRTAALISLRSKQNANKKIGVVLFNFPPNSGATGTAAHLSVFESLYHFLSGLASDGYAVDLPEDVDALRHAVLEGNAARYGADANVVATVSADDHIRHERRLSEIEEHWGPAPGRLQTDGRSIQVLGARFGNVLVGIQPAFGFEGDPMRLLFEKGFAPTHAFTAFYNYLKSDFTADAVVHFGTHGALEFMPGKQTGMSARCWSDYLTGHLPNIYLYASNNPSEAAIAKRRSGAMTVSYLTPSLAKADLYHGLTDLKSIVDRWRATPPDDRAGLRSLATMIQAQAATLDLADAEPAWDDPELHIPALRNSLVEIEQTLVPHGLHIAGTAPTTDRRIEFLQSLAAHRAGAPMPDDAIAELVAGEPASTVAQKWRLTSQLDLLEELSEFDRQISTDREIPALLHALRGGFIPPAPGGDVLNNPEVLPTGRNIHGFDPFRMPSAFACAEGAAQADLLIQRHCADGAPVPETIALVLWGTDNLKSEGAQIAQALALMGARPRFDHYGRLVGASLIPTDELVRPRIDVLMTLSGIFRDLLPIQSRMLADAALQAARADEPEDRNFVRKHALAYQAEHGVDLETAALRVFSNAAGTYGSNVNQLIDSGTWTNEDDLAQTYASRKCFAYGVNGKPVQHRELLENVLGTVDLAYQNLESVELGVTTIDHYFDTLGGIGRAIKKARGSDAPVYIVDQTQSDGKVRTLNEQVSLESRTRTLNPKWYEAMLSHGYEGVRNIEAQVTHTLGWSATTGEVSPWVYREITETFILDSKLRDRLAALNPKACSRLANRLIEASDRKYWMPDEDTLNALREAGDDLEDRLEGIMPATGATA